jgi:hypothetical protein
MPLLKFRAYYSAHLLELFAKYITRDPILMKKIYIGYIVPYLYQWITIYAFPPFVSNKCSFISYLFIKKAGSLVSRILGEVVHQMVELGADEVQGASVPQGAPLRVDHHLQQCIHRS